MSAKLDSFLRLVKEQRASDLHLSVGQPPVMRFNGELVSIRFRPLTEADLRRMLYETLSSEQQRRFEETHDLDYSYSIEACARFRVHLFRDEKGIGAAFRIIPDDVQSIDELGLPSALKQLAKLSKGLVLVTGATGSGKSTTLAAILNEINDTRRKHIITIEDPVEFVHRSRMSVFSQREVGTHCSDFKSALRSCLRESPDVILVGELRDVETISLAVTCSETGALVFGSLHTLSAAKTIDRMIDVFPDVQQEQVRSMLSLNLKGIVSQTLVRTADGTQRCAAVEILFGSSALGNLIRENKIYQIESLIQTGGYEKTGMQTHDQALMRLIDQGRVTPEEARIHARDTTLFERYFRSAS